MATIYAIRGLLLEEVLLNLLRASGYLAIENANNDNTLEESSSGLKVKGRGSTHQIDAIADFSVSPPFSYPIRLLLEAKFHSKNVGIEIIRNAVGVLKDVGEFWVVENNRAYKPRYHYQYAIFTSSSFTRQAQEYAFAQDIYLIKLENNKYFHPMIQALGELNHKDFRGLSPDSINIDLTELRRTIRASLKRGSSGSYRISQYCNDHNFDERKISNIVRLNSDLGTSYLGVLGNSFPIFLTPSQSFNIEHLISDPEIRICWNNEKWYVVKRWANCQDLNGNDIIFSFDLPLELFNLYSKNNILSQRMALNLKEDFMSSIKIMFRREDSNITSFLVLKLDKDWLRNMRNGN